MSFIQAAPQLLNAYSDDRLLVDWLEMAVPDAVLSEIRPGLLQLGDRVVGDIAVSARDADNQPPVHEPYDAWGRRIDAIHTSQGWQALHRAAAVEGIVATAYEQQHGPWSRVHQFVRLYLFHPSSALYSCPLAMTDGAATVLNALGTDLLRERAVSRLTSRDPDKFWTSGQWMTERSGGSDVSQTETIARRDGGAWRLYGNKWFSSAATSDMALTLARGEDREGLSLYYVETRTNQGAYNGIRIDRLKDKLGTRSMPTAELTLDGAQAQMVGSPGSGVRNIAGMLNITRLYNSVCAIATMRRGLALAADYATRRHASGRTLIELQLHRQTLAGLFANLQGAFHLVFHLGQLLGRDETGQSTEHERKILRLLIPATKLYTARLAVATMSEVLEAFGGAGYIEDTGLPKLLRDAQVLPIWEGTTNVLSLDVRRVIAKSDALQAAGNDVIARTASLDPAIAARFANAVGALYQWPEMEAAARGRAMGLARTFAAGLLAEHAARDDAPASTKAASLLYMSEPLLESPVNDVLMDAARSMFNA